MTPRTIGWLLTRARREAGLSQAEVAKRMGTSQAAVSRLEMGRAAPTVDLIERYASAVGQSITLTFGDTQVSDREVRRRRARSALRGYRFDPYRRNPTPAERRTLIADGIERP